MEHSEHKSFSCSIVCSLDGMLLSHLLRLDNASYSTLPRRSFPVILRKVGTDLCFYFPLNFNLSQFPFILPTFPLLLPLNIFYTVNWDLPYKIKIHAHTYLCVYFVCMLQFWLIPFRSSQYPTSSLFKVWSVDQFQWHPFRAC